jgi:hypothetical protein
MSTNPHPLSPSSSLRDLHSHSGAASRPSDRYGGHEEHPTASEPHPGEVHTSPTHENPIHDVHDVHDVHDNGTEQRSTPGFQPFFTLVEDAHTSDYHHPTVHYIFSDDDTDIVTEAALRSLEAQQTQPGKEQVPRSDETSEKSTLLPPPIPGVRENYIVLDVEPVHPSTTPDPAAPNPGIGETKSNTPHQSPGPVPPQFRVTSAKSFSPSWQVLSSEMVAAPTFDNGNGNTDDSGHGLMLKIRGTGGISGEIGKERGPPRLEDMMDQFAKRMRELQMIIDAADIEGKKEEEGDDGEEKEVEEHS